MKNKSLKLLSLIVATLLALQLSQAVFVAQPTDSETEHTEQNEIDFSEFDKPEMLTENDILPENETVPEIQNVTIPSGGVSGTCGTNATWTLTVDGTLTISGSGDMANYGSCDAPWFSYRDQIKKVVISDQITSIGDYAFYYLTSLTSINIPSSIERIGTSVFDCCFSLSTINVENNNMYFSSEYGILYNKNKTELIQCPMSSKRTYYAIPDSVITIYGDAFSNCKFISQIVIPESVTDIGDSAFVWCQSLKSINIPSSVLSIGEYAFRGCTSLNSIYIPSSVTNIGSGSFSACNSLKSINVASDNTKYLSENGVLFNKEKTKLIQYPAGMELTEYSIPSSVISIGYFAFSNCHLLTTIEIPSSVTSIDSYAFSGCCITVYFEGNAPTVASDSFDSGSVLMYYQNKDGWDVTNNIWNGFYAFPRDINYEITGSCGDSATYTLNVYTKLLTISGSGDMTEYGYNNTPWNGFRSLISTVEVGSGITNIGSHAFTECTLLTSIKIPASITSIGESAFEVCSSLTSIGIPASVAGIGDSAFYACKKLQSVIFEEGSKLTNIGYFAFGHCTSLTTIEIPSSVTIIGEYAFNGCTNLKNVFMLGDAPTVQDDSFDFENVTFFYIEDKSGYDSNGWENRNCFAFSDVNEDGIINVLDAIAMKNILTQLLKMYDFNRDGNINNGDIAYISDLILN